MNPPDDSAIAQLRREFAQLALAMKIALFALLLGASYCAIRTALYIPPFDRIYRDMLGTDPALPLDTRIAIAGKYGFIALACALPAVGLVSLFVKRAVHSVILLVTCLALASGEYFFIWWSFADPLVAIIQRMSSQTP